MISQKCQDEIAGLAKLAATWWGAHLRRPVEAKVENIDTPQMAWAMRITTAQALKLPPLPPEKIEEFEVALAAYLTKAALTELERWGQEDFDRLYLATVHTDYNPDYGLDYVARKVGINLGDTRSPRLPWKASTFLWRDRVETINAGGRTTLRLENR